MISSWYWHQSPDAFFVYCGWRLVELSTNESSSRKFPPGAIEMALAIVGIICTKVFICALYHCALYHEVFLYRNSGNSDATRSYCRIGRRFAVYSPGKGSHARRMTDPHYSSWSRPFRADTHKCPDLCDRANAAWWEPYDLHALAHLGLDLYYTDPTQHLDDLDRDLYTTAVYITPRCADFPCSIYPQHSSWNWCRC